MEELTDQLSLRQAGSVALDSGERQPAREFTELNCNLEARTPAHAPEDVQLHFIRIM